jgi:signal transduction histidine kinase
MTQLENRRLLIVDDEEEIRNSYQEVLHYKQIQKLNSSRMELTKLTQNLVENINLNIETYFASSGDDALALLVENLKAGRPFAGAMVDVRMPGQLDGLQFVAEAWKQDPELLVVIVTAHQDRSIDEISRKFGTPFEDQWDYLTKPFTSGEIRQKARYLVSSWNRRAREREYLKKIREQQEALLTQERLAAVGRLARSIGHEFGNILQPLLTGLDLAQLHVRDGQYEGLEDSLTEMIEAVTLGANVCQDLLTFARESSGSPLDSESCSSTTVLSCVEKALRLLRHELKKRDIQVEVQVPEELSLVMNESKLIQVLINLCKNSMESMKVAWHEQGQEPGQTKGLIQIRAQLTQRPSLQIQITDNGIGISHENLSKLFQPLFSTKGKLGNGLGLATCQQIIRANHGEISIFSKENEGTTVVLEFQTT